MLFGVRKRRQHIFFIGGKQPPVASFFAFEFSGFAGIEMVLFRVTAKNFLFSAYFYFFGDRFSGFEFRHMVMDFIKRKSKIYLSRYCFLLRGD